MVQYVAGTTKGGVNKGDVFNDPYKLGNVDPNYTSDKVVETVPTGATKLTLAWTPIVKGAFVDKDGKVLGDVKIITKEGEIKYITLADSQTEVADLAEGDRVAYEYNNVIIPQASVPTLKAEMKNMTLFAHARRIAVYYSQIAAFQAFIF